jgi:hypothetical protein
MLFPAVDPDAQNAPGEEEPDDSAPDDEETEEEVGLDAAA